jgi:hypothetical protein
VSSSHVRQTHRNWVSSKSRSQCVSVECLSGVSQWDTRFIIDIKSSQPKCAEAARRSVFCSYSRASFSYRNAISIDKHEVVGEIANSNPQSESSLLIPQFIPKSRWDTHFTIDVETSSTNTLAYARIGKVFVPLAPLSHWLLSYPAPCGGGWRLIPNNRRPWNMRDDLRLIARNNCLLGDRHREP